MADGSIIGQGTAIRGNVGGDGSVEIYGRIDGDVSVSGDVTLGAGAEVKGNISGARLTVSGTVSGDLVGSEAVVLGASATVRGDVSAPRIGIEEGAEFQGAVRMTRGSRAEPRPAPVARAEPAPHAKTSTPAKKKAPPAPVVPAVRRGAAKKKARRRR